MVYFYPHVALWEYFKYYSRHTHTHKQKVISLVKILLGSWKPSKAWWQNKNFSLGTFSQSKEKSYISSFVILVDNGNWFWPHRVLIRAEIVEKDWIHQISSSSCLWHWHHRLNLFRALFARASWTLFQHTCPMHHIPHSQTVSAGMCLDWGEWGKCPLPGDITISGVICEGLLVHGGLMCQHAGCWYEQTDAVPSFRKGHLWAEIKTLPLYALMYFHFAKMHNKCIYFQTVGAILAMCTRVNVCVCVWVRTTEIDPVHVFIRVFTFAWKASGEPACSLYSWVSEEIELWAANSLLQHWDYVLF